MELWKDIKGYENLYRISNHGNVLGVRRNKILKPTHHHGSSDVVSVKLYYNGVPDARQVKRLVYEHFIGDLGTMIAHLDGDYTNCCADNLKVVPKTERFKNRCARIVDKITGDVFDSQRDLAKLLGTSQSSVSNGMKRKSKKFERYEYKRAN